MKASKILLPAFLALALNPVMAQCGPGHGGGSGHSGHGSKQDNSGRKEDSRKVKATNTICPVMGRAVKPGRDREVVIRGNYYLVCCDGCGPAMAENHDKYLDKDGKPFNAPKNDSEKDSEKPAPPPPAQEGHQH